MDVEVVNKMGYGGTMKVAFFPKKVIEMLELMGYEKSKKGKYYKKYDTKREFIAMPDCKEDDRGDKGVVWFVFSTEPKQKMLVDEARQLSPEFDDDYVEIRETMLE